MEGKEVVGGERWLIGEEVDKRDVLSKRGKSQVKSPNDCAETSSGRDEWMLVEVLDSGLGKAQTTHSEVVIPILDKEIGGFGG